jgi:cellulose synthase operon protein C
VGHYSENRTRAEVDASSLVSVDMRAGLARCDEIAVLARAPLHGRSDLLPSDLAWSYRSGRPVSDRPIDGRRVVISDVEPPAASGLARVGAWRSAEPPDLLLSGPAATPARTLAEMRDAGTIEIHAHGLVNLAISDASFLALSPEANGRYALTAADIRREKLRREPVVILGACHAARAASYHHRPWSLATAFIEAGARAVVASPDEIQDADAGEFFDQLRGRIQRGQSPAVALRDQRREWMKSHSASDWVKRLMVFQ